MIESGVLPLAPVVARLRGQIDTATLREVEGAAGYARAVRSLRIWPAAYVVPLRDSAAANSLVSCATAQRVTVRFGVAIVARDIAADAGRGAVSELESLRAAIHTVLVGWLPEGALRPVEARGGRLTSDIGKDGLMVWQADYDAEVWLRNTNGES